jgi:hypothetical protein
MRCKLLLASLFVLLASTAPSYAYLDPGTGSLLLQSAIAGIAAAGATIGLYWQRVKLLFSRKRTKNGEDEPEK